jgi:serine protease Do
MRVLSVSLSLAVGVWSATAAAMSPKDVYKKAGPAVVLILGSDDGKSGSGGTGSIITAEGKIVTNAHVVLNESNQPFKILYVFLKPPKITGDNTKDLVNRYKARVLSYSVAEELDLALLQIENPPPNLPTIAFGDPDQVEIGDDAIAIGHPEQAGLWTLTTGKVSTLIANFNRIAGKNVFQTDASVNRGNSGGPLLDAEGNLIGINTMIARQGAGGIAITGVNFSLQSSVAVKWLAGQGMGLAYTPKGQTEQVVVAVAPEPQKPAATGAAQVAGPAVVEQKPVSEPPAATIVLAEAPPSKEEVAKVKSEGQQIGKQKEAEKASGAAIEPKKEAKGQVLTEKKPFSLDDLRKQQMKELEDMMQDMRGKVDEKKKGGGKGMGLW